MSGIGSVEIVMPPDRTTRIIKVWTTDDKLVWSGDIHEAFALSRMLRIAIEEYERVNGTDH